MIPMPYPSGIDDATKIRIAQLYSRYTEIGTRSEMMGLKVDQMKQEHSALQKEAREIEKELRSLLVIPEPPNRSTWWWMLPVAMAWAFFLVMALK